MSSADKLFGRKTNAVEDQLKARATPADKFDPIYDSESEGDDCVYSVVEVDCGEDDYRRGLNQAASYSVHGAKLNGKPMNQAYYTRVLGDMLQEYTVEREKHELCESLKELNFPHAHDQFVVQAIRHSLDHSTELQRDMSAVITLMFSRKILTTQQITRALEKLMQGVDDLKLDVPEASERLLAFIQCAVDDGCVDPDFFERLSERFLAALPERIWEEDTENVKRIRRIRNDLQKYKKAVREYEPDFFNCRDMDEVVQVLTDLEHPSLRHEFVRLLVEQSLEMTDQHREMVSNMLDKLYGTLLKPHDTQLGFARLIGVCDDLQLDSPRAVDLIAKYLVRSVVDEIIPPSFLSDNYRLHLGGATGMATLKKAQKWLSQARGKAKAVQFRKVWTGTDPTTREAREFKHDVKDAVLEYLESLDEAEATRLISNMDLAPDQCSEVVRKIIQFSMEKGINCCCMDAAVKLLNYLLSKNEIQSDNILGGFHQIYDRLEEIKLDVPDAAQQLQKYLAKAVSMSMVTLPSGSPSISVENLSAIFDQLKPSSGKAKANIQGDGEGEEEDDPFAEV